MRGTRGPLALATVRWQDPYARLIHNLDGEESGVFAELSGGYNGGSNPWQCSLDEIAGRIMQTLHVTERTGKDGVLNVSIPLGTPNADFDVVLVVQPKVAAASADGAEARGWPPGYFDLAGSIDDDTFERPPQGELPPAISLE